MTSHLLRRAAILTATGGLCLGLTACGGDSISIPDGQGGSVSIDKSGDDEFTLENDEGTVTSGTKLPDDFPSDEVPLVEGTLISAVSVNQDDGRGFSAVIQTSKSADEAFTEAVALLTDAGYESSAQFAASGSNLAGLEGPVYTVLVQQVDQGDGATISYTIAPSDS